MFDGYSGFFNKANRPGVGELIGTLTGMKYTKDLNDKEILKLLAVCAEDVYNMKNESGCLNGYGIELTDIFQFEKWGSGNCLQYGVYKITSGIHEGKTILAFRGTDSYMGGAQDVDVMISSPLIKTVISYASDYTRKFKVNWICGHSLGGLIAECVCSYTGVGGASFNAPGPWSSNAMNNLASGTCYADVPFECHLTKSDFVSYIGSAGGPDSSHIGKPKWHNSDGHSMKNLRKCLESY